MILEFMFFFPLLLLLGAACVIAHEISNLRIRTSEILIAAKRHLACTEYEHHECGKVIYICSAILEVEFRKGNREAFRKCVALRDHIHNQLHPYASVGRWARAKIGDGLSSFEVQTIRHRWVDELVAHYRSIGD